LLSGNSI
ncbi:putative transglycosylase, partial [Escherichia coli EC1865]